MGSRTEAAALEKTWLGSVIWGMYVVIVVGDIQERRLEVAAKDKGQGGRGSLTMAESLLLLYYSRPVTEGGGRLVIRGRFWSSPFLHDVWISGS